MTDFGVLTSTAETLNTFVPLCVAVAVIGLAAVLLRAAFRRLLRPHPNERPPAVARPFLSEGEHAFFQVLLQSAHPASHISCKVRLADLVTFPGDALRARNTINQKHVDFVVCDRESMCPFRVIELDDATHGRRDRRARDALVDVYLAEAGIAVTHVPAAGRYRPADLAALTEPPGRRGRAARRQRGA
ncbi:MAG TPA: DUF2726 domain-containing protein [Tepidisphaeraceae bacterium]|jgi:hypothetical protein